MNLIKRVILVSVLALGIIVYTFKELKAGWWQSSVMETVYAEDNGGYLGIMFNGKVIGLDIELKEDVLYSVIYCNGFGIYCSYDTPVVIYPIDKK